MNSPRNAVRATLVAIAVLLMTIRPLSAAPAEWTLAAFSGACTTRDTPLTVDQPALETHVRLSPLSYRSESFDPPLYYGYRAALFPHHGWLGVEGEFIHMKVFANTASTTTIAGTLRGSPVNGSAPVSTVLERFSISHGVNLLLANLVVRTSAPVSGGVARWRFTGRVGAGGSVPHAESAIGGVSQEQYEWGAWSVQGAAGVELTITRHLAALGEYKLTRTNQDVSIVDGRARTSLVTQHVAFGLAARVGR